MDKYDKPLYALRFNKGTGQDLQNAYPITRVPGLDPSRLHSPRAGNDHGITFDFKKYEELFYEVLEVRQRTLKGEFPHDIASKYYPKNWGQLSSGELPEVLRNQGLRKDRPEGCAEIVHMDAPTDLGKAIMSWLYSKKREGRLKKGHTKHFDFLETVPSCEAELAKRVHASLERAFECKYALGVARPEEVLDYLTKGQNKSKTITHYPEGSPNHPEHVQGHATAAGATGRFFTDTMHLDTLELQQIRETVYLWGFFRVMAGVHFMPSIEDGLLLGGMEGI